MRTSEGLESDRMHTAPYPQPRTRLIRTSVEHGSGGAADHPTPAGAQESSRDEDRSATNPARTPRDERRELCGDPAAQEIVCKQLDEEGRFVGAEGGARGLRNAEAVLEFPDERLDTGAVVVGASQLVDIPVEVVGDIELHGEVETVPQEDLSSAVPLVGSDRDYPVTSGRPTSDTPSRRERAEQASNAPRRLIRCPDEP